MATRQELAQAVHDQLVDVLGNYLSVQNSDAASHVELRQYADALDLPAYTFEIFETDLDYGIHGNPYPQTVNAGTNFSVTYARRKEATIDIAAHARNDDSITVNDLYNELEQRFTLLQDRTLGQQQLHSDVVAGGIDVQGSQDVSNPESEIRGDRFRVLVEYESYVTATASVLEQIDTTIEDVDDSTVEYITFTNTV